MSILFHNGQKLPFSPPPPPAETPWTPPAFVVELPSWPRVFLSNLGDLLAAPFRGPEPLDLTTATADFWPDVFVNRRLPVAPFGKAGLFHLLLIACLVGISHLPASRVHPKDPFEHAKIVYYPVSEYLPPLNDDAGSPPADVERKGEPVYARQRIISIPRDADNQSQTIVTPSPLKLLHDVPVPNIVAWTPAAPPVPTAGLSAHANLPQLAEPVAPPPQETQARLTAPRLLETTPVAPPPEAAAHRKLPELGASQVVAPPPSATAPGRARDLGTADPIAPPPGASPGVRAPSLAAAVVEPPPSPYVARPAGPMNMAKFNSDVVAPRMPVPEQQAIPTGHYGSRAAQALQAGGLGGAPVGPPPSVGAAQGAASNSHAAGQLIALGIHPVPPAGPLDVPMGNRRGTFAAGPEGKPDAPGTPNIHAGPAGSGPGGHGTGSAGAASGSSASPTAGITVAAGPVNPGPVAVAGPAPSVKASLGMPDVRKAFNTALANARPADLARAMRPNGGAPEPKIEDEVFGPKKFYQMTLNMPNLTSRGGSWIMRFAELRETQDKAELNAPVVTVKVDPAYPMELMRNRVEGVVVLYAVIHSDGSVGEVRVLRGIDQRLDANALAALQRWHFRPGTKHGSAVDLEAVVQIPFQARQSF